MKQPQNAFPASLWRSFFYSPIASVVTIGLFLLIGAGRLVCLEMGRFGRHFQS